MKITNDEGVEIEVYTADEVQAQIKAKEDEFGKTKEQIETELKEARTALNERTGEFKTFRKLNEETLAKLSVAERTIYENGLALHEEREARKVVDAGIKEERVNNVLRAKAGTDEKLFTKMKDMWKVIGIDAETPEAIEAKSKMIIGAINATEPDLLASVAGFSNGTWSPPSEKKDEDKTFADTPKGEAMAAELGLKLKVDNK